MKGHKQEPATRWSWDDDKLLVSAISTTNPELGRYALRLIDVDADQAVEMGADDEAQLGAAVISIGTDILRRAAYRAWNPR